MKKIILIGIFLLGIASMHATNHYISSSSGNDANNGKTPQTAWKSIAKLNTVRQNILPGDSVLFKCNDTFWGQIIVSSSGNSSKCIYYGSYGTGHKPVISGKTTVSNWTQTSTNIWSATCPECKSSVTNFFINDVQQQIGRWPNVTDPNKGYRTYTSHSGKTQLTDNTLSDAINWTGAEAVVRSVRWELNRFTVKSQSNGTLQLTPIGTTAGTSDFTNGFGYFIQNDPRTLDQQGEWYFNPKNKQFSIFSTTNPNTFVTKTTNCDTLMNLKWGVKYITIENLHFDAAGMLAISSYHCNNIILRNNDITFSGIDGVQTEGSNFVTFENNLINKTNNNALRMPAGNHLIIRNNTIKNTGLVPGMGLSGWNYFAMSIVYGIDYLIEYNTIDSAGYCGLELTGDSCLVRNNVFSNFCMIKDDGGGIYGCGSYKKDTSTFYTKKIIGNIVFNAIGAPEGTNWNGSMAEGIYTDGGLNADILNNTVFNCTNNGIKIHVSPHINIKGNNIYNNNVQMHFEQNPGESAISNCVVESNNFISKLATQQIMGITTVNNYIADLASFDYNYYCRPFDNSQILQFYYYTGSNMTTEVHTLKSWSSQYKKDLHSGESPIAVNAYIVNSVNSSNYITNGAFNSNIAGWYSWANYNNSKLSFVSGSGVTGGALHAEFTPPSGKTDGMMYIVSNNFTFSTNKTYRLRFAARSNKTGTTLQVIPRKNDNPYNLVADQKNFSIDTAYKQYEYIFTPFLNEPNARIDFQINEVQGDIWFDNIELVEVNAVKTNPDDYIRFEYNATKNDKNISITGDYVDVKGMPVSGNISLKPFTSIILFKKVCSGIKPATPDTIIGDLNVCQGSQVKYSISPVPGATYYTWKLPNGWTGTSNTSSIAVIPGALAGTISVIAKNVCDSSLARTLNVSLNGNAPVLSGTISGNTAVCAGTSNTYSIAAVAKADNYTWTLPTGWTGTSTTNSTTTKAGTTSGNITVTANNGCGSSDLQKINITVNPTPVTPVITWSNGILQSNAAAGNQWFRDNSIIQNAINSNYVPAKEGNYYTVVSTNGCSSAKSNIIYIPIIINKTSVPPVINNSKIDTSAWTGITETQATIWDGTPYSGFSSGFKMCYDTSNLYVLVRVQDATPHSTANNSLATWNNDNIEIYFQMDTVSKADGAYTTGDYQLRKERDVNFPAGFDGEFGGSFTPKGSSQTDFTNNTGMKIAEFDNGKVYYQEWQIPWALLTKGLAKSTAPHTTAGTYWDGQFFKFDMQVADNVNGTGRAGLVNVFSNTGKNYLDTRGFGVLMLETPINSTFLSVSPTLLNVAATANSIAIFSITSNMNWTVNSDQTWLTVSRASGSNNATITVTASANSDTSTRTATVTVSGSNVIPKTLTVIQTGSSAPVAAGTITGTAVVYKGSSKITFSVPAIPGATSYVWTLPTGATGTSTTNSISVDFGSTAVSGVIKVKGHNDFGDGKESTFAVTVNNAPAATNFYISSSSGSDSNDGKTPQTAWQSIDKVNVANLVAGDSVLFKRGEIFRGNLVPKSGTDAGSITYSAYGSGSKPKLYGSVQKSSVSDWVNEGGNIWHTIENTVNIVGSESLPNPDFNTNLTDWNEYNYTANGASAVFSRTTVAGEYITSPGGGKLVCTNQGKIRSDIQLWTSNCSIDSAKWYKFIFKAKASQPFTIPSGNITLFQNVSPWAGSSTLSKAALITTSWATYEMYFKSPITTTYGRITFYLGGVIPNGTTFYFDALSFKAVDSNPELISYDVGNVIFNNEASCGIKVRNEADLNAQDKFWHDPYNSNLKMYSVSNPASFYTNIELALDQVMADISGDSYITFENLDIRYVAACGIEGGDGSHHIWIKDLDLSWIGGGYQPGSEEWGVRYGNGIQFWCAAHDIIVERCTFDQIWDAAVSPQGAEKTFEAYNIYFRNNIIKNSEYSYELWGRPESTYLHDIYFENNTCMYAGYGWGHSQRPDPNGSHLMLWSNTTEQMKNIYIRNNIFYESSNYSALYDNIAASGKMIVENNCYYESSGPVAKIGDKYYDYATQWSEYQKVSGHDAHSVHANPLLNADFTLMNNSPCIDSGMVSIAVTDDFNRAPRPQGKNFDIGAYEYIVSCIGAVPTRPDAITGNLNVCQGLSGTYSVTSVPGANYTWKLPNGWTGTSVTNSITATAGSTGGNITLTANNGCGSSTAQILSVTTKALPATPVISLNNGILQSNTTSGNQWYLNNNLIENAVNSTFVPVMKGNYYVVTTQNGCPSQPSNIIANNSSALVIKKVNTPPNINNNTIDTTAWGGISETQAALCSGTPHSGFSSGFKMCYDESNLYVLVRVQDNTPHSTANNSLPTWNNDNVEIYFQMDTISKTDGSYTTGDYQLRKERDVNYPAGFDGEFDDNFTPKGSSKTDFTNNTGMKIAEFDNGKLYYQEWQIPWQLLTKGLASNKIPHTTPGSSWDGQYFKWDMAAANNVDGSGRFGTLFVFDNSSNNWFDTRGFGKIQLETPLGTNSLSVSATTLNVAASANSIATFNINSNTNWTVNSDKTWLTVSSASGSNNATITVTATSNTTASTRTATITVSGTGMASRTVTVTQAASPAELSVSATAFNVAATANSDASFDISSNASWNVKSDQTWLTASSASGSNNATITLKVQTNPNTTSRTATATVSGTGITDQTITVTQDGAAPVLTVSVNNLTIGARANSTKTFNITSNLNWTATDNQTWLTLSKTSGFGNTTITLTAQVNPTTSTRKATVTVSGSEVTAQTINVTQEAGPTGIESTNTTEIILYPNPTSNLFIISGVINNSTVTVYDFTGKLLLSKQLTNNQIDIGNLQHGVYTIKFADKNGMVTRKMVKR